MEVQILQPSVPLEIEFFGLETNDNYANNQLVKEEDDTDCLTGHEEILNPFKAEYDENGKEIFIPKTK